ncbi:uncharacterized protein MONBRDRAFT_33161 [Monosiga brevicollis MX1]|uniref:DUS-like FMN-binding domain-containing protein n=1 Tax=Monosiga brevicollis TaxID=81824 RepID=A9V413_MONBE|nr:uncharacterized protein MONBRDRAFT_33161 [Monosiga brevicollis MX1]EDQ87804.1 predicted protein [Monosiga brevicollis MX1]|eukprot:XP_001747337.1 hypothetical protein [Monosiga brevicollis MX1]
MSAMYANKVMLAPMVRAGTLPTRLLALRYGADLVYSEELIDHRMLACRRVENPVLQTIDYIDGDGEVAFRTCAEEKNRVILQIGTSDPDRAARVAQMMAADVAGIDVNMGCPKPFSIKGDMGAALLRQPDRVRDILTSLVATTTKPITCKIRVLPTLEETLNLVNIIQDAGVAALGIHGRVPNQRPREPITDYQYEAIRAVAKACRIPVICNGGSLDMDSYDDILAFRDKCGCSSVMVARAAQYNMSIFSPQGLKTQQEVVKDYIKIAVDYNIVLDNMKYNVIKALHNLTTELGPQLHAVRTSRDLAVMFDLGDYYDAVAARHRELEASTGYSLRSTDNSDERMAKEALQSLLSPAAASAAEAALAADTEEDGQPAPKQSKLDAIVMPVVYTRAKRRKYRVPKEVLMAYTQRMQLEEPSFSSTPVNKKFVAVCHWLGEQYATSAGHGNRRYAEQAAALVALIGRGMARDTGEAIEYSAQLMDTAFKA